MSSGHWPLTDTHKVQLIVLLLQTFPLVFLRVSLLTKQFATSATRIILLLQVNRLHVPFETICVCQDAAAECAQYAAVLKKCEAAASSARCANLQDSKQRRNQLLIITSPAHYDALSQSS